MELAWEAGVGAGGDRGRDSERAHDGGGADVPTRSRPNVVKLVSPKCKPFEFFHSHGYMHACMQIPFWCGAGTAGTVSFAAAGCFFFRNTDRLVPSRAQVLWSEFVLPLVGREAH
jgi:hypothetical protein